MDLRDIKWVLKDDPVTGRYVLLMGYGLSWSSSILDDPFDIRTLPTILSRHMMSMQDHLDMRQGLNPIRMLR